MNEPFMLVVDSNNYHDRVICESMEEAWITLLNNFYEDEDDIVHFNIGETIVDLIMRGYTITFHADF